ncbi:helix-turn-helix transcriptional regulator [Terriglobus sp. RCC_193]|uniref:helix-turn-helix transcriptional regulator n=1 Tax=Terriglobus sp. RCC_193 TaxID=3239218 RepID=UPI0035232F82
MSAIGSIPEQDPDVISELPKAQLSIVPPTRRKGPHRALTPNPAMSDPLLTVEDVGRRLNVSRDWVWDHCSRKKPRLPFIRMGDGALRFRASAIEAFINERERLSAMHTGGRRKA